MPGMKKSADPEGPLLAPDLHAVAGVVVADDMLLGVIALAHDGQLRHIEPRPLECLDAGFRLGV